MNPVHKDSPVLYCLDCSYLLSLRGDVFRHYGHNVIEVELCKELEGLYCSKCGAEADRYIRMYENPGDPQEQVFQCLKCGADRLWLE